MLKNTCNVAVAPLPQKM